MLCHTAQDGRPRSGVLLPALMLKGDMAKMNSLKSFDQTKNSQHDNYK